MLKYRCGGLSALNVTPVTTTPNTARNNNVLIIPVVNIPAIAERFTNGKNSFLSYQNLKVCVHQQM